MSRAIVLGNGNSRLKFDLDILQQGYLIYGCNALYREFTPDYLVAVDPPMLREIIKSGYTTNNIIYSFNRIKHHFTNVKYLTPNRNFSSGPTALWLASQHNHTEINLIGFDINSTNDKINNVYAGTKNYKDINSPPIFYKNWVSQMCTIFEEYPHLSYKRILTSIYDFIPDEFKLIRNLTHVRI